MQKVDLAKRQLYVANKLKELERDGEIAKVFDEKLRASGWHESLKNYCKHEMRKVGLGRMTVEKLQEVQEMATIKGKNTVPLAIRDEVFNEVVRSLVEEGIMPPEKRYKREIGEY